MNCFDNPILTVAFPLYKSRKFLSNIITQIENLIQPNYQVIVSDRHCYDNTIDVLQERYGDDQRFLFVKKRDELNWVEHHNELIRLATGKYFVWISHDDNYETQYCRILVDYLEQNPQTILATGKMNVKKHLFYPFPIHSYSDDKLLILNGSYPYSTKQLLRLIYDPDSVAVWNGVLRRDFVVRHNLFVRYTTKTTAFVEFYWIFGLALHGKLHYLPAACFTKYFQPTSLHATWLAETKTLSLHADLRRIAHSYIADSRLSAFFKAKLFVAFYVIFLVKSIKIILLKDCGLISKWKT